MSVRMIDRAIAIARKNEMCTRYANSDIFDFF